MNQTLPGMFTLAAALLWAVAAAGIAWAIIAMFREYAALARSDARREEHGIPVFFKLLLPLTARLLPLFRKPAFDGERDTAGRRLVQAGMESAMKPEEFLAIQALAPIAGGTPLALLYLVMLSAASAKPIFPLSSTNIAMCLALFLLAAVYPASWLRRKVAERLRAIVRALPFVIDLLTLSVEAGLDFMAAIKNIMDRRPNDAISSELSRMLMEIQLGKTRREAMRHLADRVGQPEVVSLMTALIQADEMGVSLGATLRIQSDQVRARRFIRAEKMANEAPVKILFPLVVFIFPAVFIILLGPIVMQLLRHGF